ncbi:MAG TPA: hypothetical protein VFH63_10595 [candidate division Zixibacteria bacterium]|nr:hypothetical protein [candidate division Zixibacteria bacterium]
MTDRPIPSHIRARSGPLAMLLLLGLVLAACGGGGGGGGNGDTYRLRVAVVNETDGPIDVSVDVAGEPGEPQTLESCTGQVLEFSIPAFDEWVLTADGQVAIDSATFEDTLRERNLIAEVWVLEDGTVEQQTLSPGSNIGPPAQAGICI